MNFSITLVLVVITALISIGAFSNQKIMDDLIFYPPAIQRGQWYRFISHGFIHADAGHLIFNMIALYSFGETLEDVLGFDCVFGHYGKIVYLILYFTSLFMASYPDYLKYKDSYHFKSLGASGAVSAVIFATILFFPQTPVGVIFIPGVRVPGWLFAIIYLGITVYLNKRGGGNINHSAHFWGAAFGVAFTIVACMFAAIDFNVFQNFLAQLKSSSKQLTLYCGR